MTRLARWLVIIVLLAWPLVYASIRPTGHRGADYFSLVVAVILAPIAVLAIGFLFYRRPLWSPFGGIAVYFALSYGGAWLSYAVSEVLPLVPFLPTFILIQAVAALALIRLKRGLPAGVAEFMVAVVLFVITTAVLWEVFPPHT